MSVHGDVHGAPVVGAEAPGAVHLWGCRPLGL